MVFFSCCVNVMIIPLTSEATDVNWNSTNKLNGKTIDSTEINFYTFSEEFGLVNEQKGKIDHSSSFYLLGSMLVGPLALQLSDIYGRRLPFLLASYASVVANFVAAMSPTYSIFLSARFVTGIADACCFSMASTITAESVSTEFRNYSPIFFNFFWLAGYMFIGVLRLFIYRWRWLWAIAAVPPLLVLPLYHQIPESLHFLIGKKKHTEVKEYIARVSKYNGQVVDLQYCRIQEKMNPLRQQRTVIDVIQSPTLLRTLVVNGYIYIILSFTYWALSLYSGELSSDKMTGFFLSGLVEIPGALIGNLMIYQWSRRTVSFLCLITISTSLTTAAVSPAHSLLSTFFSLVAKCFSVALICNQPLFVMESSPTTVRNIIIGIVGFMRDLGASLTPYVMWLNNYGQNTAVISISILAAIASATVFLLPETKGKQLPEDIGDVELDRNCRRRNDEYERILLSDFDC